MFIKVESLKPWGIQNHWKASLRIFSLDQRDQRDQRAKRAKSKVFNWIFKNK